jgi:regulatory protein
MRKRSGQALDPDEDPASAARAIVLRQLTGSAKSRKQLADKLAERLVPAEVAAAVLDRFEEVRLIDDAEFAQMWVRSRSEGRKLARSALRRELAEKGIDPELAEAALEQLGPGDEQRAARELVSRRITPRSLAEAAVPAGREKLTRRLVGQLARKGYAPSMALSIVREELAAREADESEDTDGTEVIDFD